ncbi:toxin YoeB [Flavobacterium arsenatis]|uniref:Toxin YoeB n=1 Tax=Flavobacterium arsenatis TaxID=1484332 RepID=A0ABU1TK58_9FLAO|nr:type II toxin-antitoxin system RelE/ParE family toxin [Flavobacterium arsenatis]MDR6966370.1 toxin YoeB [Flavobacterium arsenatis]
MAKKEIVWSSLAEIQLQTVLEFYSERNGNSNYSLKLLDEVENLLETISHSELIGRLTSNKYTRVIPLKTYLIFYEVNNDRIEIVAFWDNRQDSESRKVK